MLNLTEDSLKYPDIHNLFLEYRDPKRNDSAAFLIWYLINYYRLDSLEAIDSVCDQNGDKGVDGIYVNDNDMTITIFQSRISQRSDTQIGDSSLREFQGTLQQFSTKETIENLLSTAGEAEVARLVERLDLKNKILTHERHGIFISNLDIDSNGTAYLNTNPDIVFVGKNNLISNYISDKRATPISTPAEFVIQGFSASEYFADASTRAIIVPIKAKELVNLPGIADQGLFVFNVRGPLGKTKVNKDIIKSIKDSNMHKLFPLFHNGITIICNELSKTDDKIHIENYFVVNGCQSLTSLYEHRQNLTDDLRILTKFIKIDTQSILSEKITLYSNNQNGVNQRDFQSNSPIQIRLQNDFKNHFPDLYSFEIKRGEKLIENTEKISNEDAGLYLMAFDLKEPWATHRKYQVFDEKFSELFARPEVNADRIVLCYILAKVINNKIQNIDNKLFGKYALTKHMILYIIRLILENDSEGKKALNNPSEFVRNITNRNNFIKCIDKIIDDMIIDLNAEVKEYGDDFDYRGKLRDHVWVKKLANTVLNDYLKLANRGRIESFEKEWQNLKK